MEPLQNRDYSEEYCGKDDDFRLHTFYISEDEGVSSSNGTGRRGRRIVGFSWGTCGRSSITLLSC